VASSFSPIKEGKRRRRIIKEEENIEILLSWTAKGKKERRKKIDSWSRERA